MVNHQFKTKCESRVHFNFLTSEAGGGRELKSWCWTKSKYSRVSAKEGFSAPKVLLLQGQNLIIERIRHYDLEWEYLWECSEEYWTTMICWTHWVCRQVHSPLWATRSVAPSCLKILQRLQMRQVTYRTMLLPLLLTIRLIGLKSEHRCAAPAKGEKEPQESSINNATDWILYPPRMLDTVHELDSRMLGKKKTT